MKAIISHSAACSFITKIVEKLHLTRMTTLKRTVCLLHCWFETSIYISRDS